MKKIFYSVVGGPSGVCITRGIFDFKRDALECAGKYETYEIYRFVEIDGKRVESKIIKEKK